MSEPDVLQVRGGTRLDALAEVSVLAVVDDDGQAVLEHEHGAHVEHVAHARQLARLLQEDLLLHAHHVEEDGAVVVAVGALDLLAVRRLSQELAPRVALKAKVLRGERRRNEIRGMPCRDPN